MLIEKKNDASKVIWNFKSIKLKSKKCLFLFYVVLGWLWYSEIEYNRTKIDKIKLMILSMTNLVVMAVNSFYSFF